MVHGLPAQEQSNGSILQNEVLHDLDVNNAPYILEIMHLAVVGNKIA